jgi:hypothetical protein
VAQSWNLAGTYFETCNCDVACPCVFHSPPSLGQCTVLVAWHVDNGQFNGVALNDLNVALAVHTPGNMIQGDWQAALYLDDRATAGQKDALLRIFTGQAGGHPAMLVSFVTQFLGAKSVPMEYQADGKRRSLRIPGVAEAEIEALSGQDGAEATISGHPLCIAPGHPAVVAKSKRLSYRDYDFHWEISDRNGFYSPFTYRAS